MGSAWLYAHLGQHHEPQTFAGEVGGYVFLGLIVTLVVYVMWKCYKEGPIA